MISATAVAQASGFDFGALWDTLEGVGALAAVITLLLTLPTYVSNLLAPLRVTSANYQVASDKTMAITITVKNRHSDERSLTALIIGQPPDLWHRLRPKWWVGLVGSKLFDINIEALGPIPSGDSKKFDSVAMTRLKGTPVEDTLPSNARVLAYCGADRPCVKRPKKIGGLPSTTSKPSPET